MYRAMMGHHVHPVRVLAVASLWHWLCLTAALAVASLWHWLWPHCGISRGLTVALAVATLYTLYTTVATLYTTVTTLRHHRGLPGDHSGLCGSEVATVSGSLVTPAVGSVVKTIAESSVIDLADLRFYGPRWKSPFFYRPRVKFRVTLLFSTIVVFSEWDRSKHALKHLFYRNQCYSRKTRVLARLATFSHIKGPKTTVKACPCGHFSQVLLCRSPF